MTSPYAVPLSVLDAVHVADVDQVQGQDVDPVHDYVTSTELDRVRLLSTTGAGRLRVP